MALAKLKGNDYLRFLFFIFFNKIYFYLYIMLHLSKWEKETTEIPVPCHRMNENSRTFSYLNALAFCCIGSPVKIELHAQKKPMAVCQK